MTRRRKGRVTEHEGCIAWDVSINDVCEEETHAIAEQHDHITHDLCHSVRHERLGESVRHECLKDAPR